MTTFINKRSWRVWLSYLSLIMTLGVSVSAAAEEICEYSVLESAFKEYVLSIDQIQVEIIQNRLNKNGYGLINVDGVLGIDTRHALQKVCRDFYVPDGEDIAADVVKRLDIINGIIEKNSKWNLIVSGAPFNGWLVEKSPEDQIVSKQILATGSADAIITLLNQFDASMTIIASQEILPSIPAPILAPAPPCIKQITLPLEDDITVYYLWQGEKKPAADDEQDKNQEPCTPVEETINTDLLAPIKGVVYPNRRLFLQAVENLFAVTDSEQLQLLSESRHEMLIPPTSIQVEANGCGCSREFSSTVYGFYPTWVAQKDQVLKVDFSLFDRIGFYALTLDSTGAINQPLQWVDDMGSATFINTAHQHHVEVDLTIYASEWRDWNDAVIDNAINSTMKSVMQKLNDKNAPLSTYLPAIIKNGSAPQIDGITLYFDNYTASDIGRDNVIKIVSKLSKRLQVAGRKIDLNIMLGIDTNTLERQPVFKDLAAILLESEEGPAKVDHVLVFLQESTSKAKKQIRRKIEDEFRGAERKAVLRKIIPVISPLGHERDPRGPYSQFTDDLIYFQDNFAGVGFWPLPVPDDAGVVAIKDALVSLYVSTTPSNQFGSMVSSFAPQLCQFACPNRWLFRIGFDLLAGMLLLYALFSVWFSRPRELFKKHFLYFIIAIVATVVIAIISLICDPFWQEQADVVLVGIIVTGVAYALWRYVSRVTQFPLP